MSYLQPAGPTLRLCVNLTPVVQLFLRGRSDTEGVRPRFSPDDLAALVGLAQTAVEAGADRVSLPAWLDKLDLKALALAAPLRLLCGSDHAFLARALDLLTDAPIQIGVEQGAGMATIIPEPLRRHLILGIENDLAQLNAALNSGFMHIELSATDQCVSAEARRDAVIQQAAINGMVVTLGQGIDFSNAEAFASKPEISEIHLGQSLAIRALQKGWTTAISELQALLQRGRLSGIL